MSDPALSDLQNHTLQVFNDNYGVDWWEKRESGVYVVFDDGDDAWIDNQGVGTIPAEEADTYEPAATA